MKYLESKFQVAMPGGKGEWPWPRRDTISNGEQSITRDDGETAEHFVERGKRLLFSDAEIPPICQDCYKPLIPQATLFGGKDDLVHGDTLLVRCGPANEEADAIVDHGGEA